MAKGTQQKLKMLYLVKIFSEETDEMHALTMPEVISKLNACGVNADRKTLYLDFEELRTFGLDLLSEQRGRQTFYYLASREFELPELKLLVDSVQAAKFITERKSRDLIKKLESLVSRHEAGHLQRQVLISGRVKTMNESIYYNVDKRHEAINKDRQIRFQYFQWNVKKEMELRKDGDFYHVSPWGLMWDDEYYYLVGYDGADRKIKHFRVDKMLRITLVDKERDGKEEFGQFDMARYGKGIFGMFGGEETRVTLEAKNSMAGILIDRFGKDLMIIPKDKMHFRTNVNVALSRQFLGWIFALGEDIKIVGPDSVVEQMREEAAGLLARYSEN